MIYIINVLINIIGLVIINFCCFLYVDLEANKPSIAFLILMFGNCIGGLLYRYDN